MAKQTEWKDPDVAGARGKSGRKTPFSALVALLLISFITFCVPTGGNGGEQGAASSDPLSEPTPEQLQTLIEELGDASFARRQRAAQEIQRFGILAFEALHAAQYHPDSEIAIAARDLLGNIQVSWERPSDSDAVRNALANYGMLRAEKRKERMERLAELEDHAGLAALGRLARYEMDLRLRREAALLIMLQPDADRDPWRNLIAKQIRDVIPASSRLPNPWLRLYADDLESQTCSVQAWSRELAAERRRLEDRTTHQTDPGVIVDLAQAAALRAIAAGDDSQATEFLRSRLEFLQPRRPVVLAALQWAYRHGLWEATIEVANAHQETVAQYALLQYWVAAAHRKSGREDEAQRWAEMALAANPIDSNDSDTGGSESRSDAYIRNIHRHLEIAQLLKEEGHAEWAEQEYRAVLEVVDVDTTYAVEAAEGLSRLLFDQRRYAEAAAVLAPVSYRLSADSAFQKRIASEVHHAKHYFRSRLLLSQAKAAAAEEQWAECRERLRAALAEEPLNSDILIAMYEAEGEESWRNYVERTIASAAAELEASIEARERERPNLSDPSALQTATRMLAKYCNEYAWLISHTFGNREKALERSKRSVELVPNSSHYLETLAHTYWSLGNKKMAIARQREALELQPHSLPMQRRLELFLESDPPQR